MTNWKPYRYPKANRQPRPRYRTRPSLSRIATALLSSLITALTGAIWDAEPSRRWIANRLRK